MERPLRTPPILKKEAFSSRIKKAIFNLFEDSPPNPPYLEELNNKASSQYPPNGKSLKFLKEEFPILLIGVS